METSYHDERDRQDLSRVVLKHRLEDGSYSVQDLLEHGLVTLGRPDVDARTVVESLVARVLSGRVIVPLGPTFSQVVSYRKALRRHVETVPPLDRSRLWTRVTLPDGSSRWNLPTDEKAAVRYRAMVRNRPRLTDV